MKTVNVPLPDKLGIEVENCVKSGWFTDEAELMRIALQEFIRHNRLKLMEQFMREDIDWALKIKTENKRIPLVVRADSKTILNHQNRAG